MYILSETAVIWILRDSVFWDNGIVHFGKHKLITFVKN